MRVRNMGDYLLAKEHGMKIYIPIAKIGMRRLPCNKPFDRAREAKAYGQTVSDRYENLKRAEKVTQKNVWNYLLDLLRRLIKWIGLKVK